MRNIFTYSFILSFLVLCGCRGCYEKKLPSLKETYQQNDKKPFGGFVAFNEMPVLLNQETVNISDGPLAVLWNSIKEEDGSAKVLYFLITKNLLLNYHEVNTLLKFAAGGNDLFISADYIQPDLLKGLHCRVTREKEANVESEGALQNAFVLDFAAENPPLEFNYYYYPFYNSIQFEKKSGTALGYNQIKESNFVELKHGKGRVFLHAAPRAFGNYFLLTGNNLDYYKYVLSTLETDVDYIFWDEYYKLTPDNRKIQQDQKENFSSLRVLKKNPSLMRAFWLAIAGILIFVVFNIKRKQRPIAQIPPKSNATVEFTEIIGRLYLQHKDNKNIAEKQITYFYEKIRKHYFIQAKEVDEVFLRALAGKSGVDTEVITDLFRLIKYIQHAEEISDKELLALNDKIVTFNKKRK